MKHSVWLSLVFLIIFTANSINPSSVVVIPKVQRESSASRSVRIGEWMLELDSGNNLAVAAGSVWVNLNNSETPKGAAACSYHRGRVKGKGRNSRAAITLCQDQVMGIVWIDPEVYFIEPLSDDGKHLLYSRKSRNKRSESTAYWMYNLTGDTIDFGEEEINPDPEHFRDKDDDLNWDNNFGDEEGYFYDSTWSPNIFSNSLPTSASSTEKFTTKWLEIAVAVDHTLISFHGKGKVERYVLSLMNIVSAIYQDSSLGAGLKLAISRLLMYEHRKSTVIKPGNAKRSLENVNFWNRRLLATLGEHRRHDVAVWFTRSDIGGPSGYAPVAGVCNPKRSCALIRDEGLTSAFIIAHEVAHILGLSHDGDKKNDNDCKIDALDGSIMAPMVTATFNKFFWSECSRNEFMKNSKKWTCLDNEPFNSNAIKLNVSLETSFTMDEQCRMEFGNGYSMCRAFEIIESCSHLWCGHEHTPLVCKTKKGPPLEGTECAFGKWCSKGYCNDITINSSNVIPIVLNPQNGAWSNWSSWGSCSRTCGSGVQYRLRKCDNPPPLYGGKACQGDAEEWKICTNRLCQEVGSDYRSLQCKKLSKILNLNGTSTWLPYENAADNKKCKLICFNMEKREIYETEENLADGTPCSYDNPDDICIQGKCYKVDCKGKTPPKIQRDNCGICNGNNSDCMQVNRLRHKVLRRETSRVAILPKMTRNFKVNFNVSSLEGSINLGVKNRNKNKYAVVTPKREIQHKIFENVILSYKKNGTNCQIWGKGPLSSETVFLIIIPKKIIPNNLTLSSNISYYIHKDYLNASKRYTWILGGWGPCSASCGGGRRQKTTACWDSFKDRIVKKNFCSLLQKPKLESEKCNNFKCDFQWVVGSWEPCSVSCGSKGSQSREVYCIPISEIGKILDKNNETMMNKVWTHMVSPGKCSGEKPFDLKPCNRQPCVSYWTISNWSQCSNQCGKGLQTRDISCDPPGEETVFSCVDQIPKQIRNCSSTQSCKFKYKHGVDVSKFCSFDLLHKYCVLKGFQRICNKSC